MGCDNHLSTLLPVDEIRSHLKFLPTNEVSYTIFDTRDKPLFVVDAEGHVTGYQYDKNGNETSRCHYGKTIVLPLEIDYLSVKDLVSKWVPNPKTDHVVEYVYDAANRKAKTIESTFSPLSDKIETRETAHFYDALNREIKTQETDGQFSYHFYDMKDRLVMEVSKVGQVTAYQYDDLKQVYTTVHYAELTDIAALNAIMDRLPTVADVKIKETPEKDRLTLTTQDAAGNVQFELDANHYVTEHAYNAMGELIRTIQYAKKLDDSQINQLRNNKLVLTPDVLVDRCTQRYLDARNQLVIEQDPAGYMTTYRRDTFGNITKKTQYATKHTILFFEPTKNKELPAIPPDLPTEDAITIYAWSKRNLCVLRVDAEQGVDQIVYDANKQQIQVTRLASKISVSTAEFCFENHLPTASSQDEITYWQYDRVHRQIVKYSANRLIKKDIFDGLGHQIDSEEYDANRMNQIDPDTTRSFKKRFDGWGNAVQICPPMVSNLLALIDANPDIKDKEAAKEEVWQEQSKRIIYNEVGLKIQSLDTLGHITVYYYDLAHRPVLLINPEREAISYVYNTFDERVQQRHYATHLTPENFAKCQGGFISDEVLSYLTPTEQDAVEQWGYDDCGHKLEWVDPENYQTCWAYNAWGEPIEEQLPLEKNESSFFILREYDTRGHEVKTTHQGKSETITITQSFDLFSGLLCQRTDEVGASFEYQYDRVGNRIAIIDPVPESGKNKIVAHVCSYDSFHRMVSDKDALGFETTYSYDTQQCTQTIVYPALNLEKTIITNVFSEKIEEKEELSYQRKITQTWTHAPSGAIASITDATEHTTTDDYNTESWLVLHCDSIGIKTERHYDKVGRIQTVIEEIDSQKFTTVYQRNALGFEETVINRRDIVTKNTYNRKGNCIKSVKDYGNTQAPGLRLSVLQQYNGQGTETQFIEGDDSHPDQYRIHYLQDSINRSIAKIVDPSHDNYEGLHLLHQNKLDKKNRVIKHIDPNGNINRIFFDACGNKRFTLNAVNSLVEWTFNEAQQVICRREYAQVIDASIITDNTTLDELIALVKPAQSNSLDELRYYYYDAIGRRCFEVVNYYNDDLKKSEGFVVETRYDGASSHEISVIGYAKVIPDFVSEQFTYSLLVMYFNNKTHHSDYDRITYYINDGKGQQRFQIDPEGAVTQYEYDGLGRIITEIKYALTLPVSLRASTAQLPPEQVTIQTHPTEDRTTYTAFNFFNKPLAILNPVGSLVTHNYDANGNLTQTCHFHDALVGIQNYEQFLQKYTSLVPNPGQGDRITSYTIDSVDRTHEITDSLNYQDIFDHDALGNAVSYQDRNQQLWTFQYDRAKRMVLEISPETDVYHLEQNSDGLFSPVKTRRTVKNYNVYDSNNNVLEIIKDYDNSPGVKTTPRLASLSYTAEDQQKTITIKQVPIDDPGKAPNFITQPVKLVDIQNSSLYNAFGLLIVSIENSESLAFSVYDNAKRPVFKVYTDNAVEGFEYNVFGNVILERKYANPLNLDLSNYLSTGLSLSLIKMNLRPDNDQDRITRYQYDNRGDQIQIDWPPSICFNPAHAVPKVEEANPQTFYRQNAFRNRILIEKTKFPNELSHLNKTTCFWYDRLGNTLAEAERVLSQLPDSIYKIPVYEYSVKRTSFNAFSEEKTHVVYEKTVMAEVNNLSFIDLISKCQSSPGKDKVKRNTYNLRGEIIKKEKVDVVRQSIIDLSPPAFSDTTVTLSRHFVYNPTGQCIAEQDSVGNWIFTAFNERGFEVARTHVARVSDKEGVLIPLTQFKINSHGQKIMATRYVNGTRASKLTDPLDPVNPDPANDQTEYYDYDTRGLTILIQDAENHLKGNTYTLSKKPARQFWRRTNWEAPNNVAIQVPHWEEKRWTYDKRQRPEEMCLIRDGLVDEESLVVHQYTIFGETAAIGSGQGATPFPEYYRYDRAGQKWNSNEAGYPVISLHDLTGFPTAKLEAALLNNNPDYTLANVTNIDELSAALKDKDLELTDYFPDPAGRILREVSPSFNATNPTQYTDPNHLPKIQIFIESSQIDKQTLLTWPELAGSNVQPTLALWPKNNLGLKRLMPIETKNGLHSIDVSNLATDIYQYQIIYTLKQPENGSQPLLMFQATGIVQFDTGFYQDRDGSHTSQSIVTQIKKGAELWITGAAQNLEGVELWREDKLLGTYQTTATEDPRCFFVDLGDKKDNQGNFLVSGRQYHIKPIRNKIVEPSLSLPFTLYTKTPPVEPLSYQIPCQASLNTLGQYGELDVTVPEAYQSGDREILCKYTYATDPDLSDGQIKINKIKDKQTISFSLAASDHKNIILNYLTTENGHRHITLFAKDKSGELVLRAVDKDSHLYKALEKCDSPELLPPSYQQQLFYLAALLLDRVSEGLHCDRIKAGTDKGHYKDSKGNELLCNTIFEHEVLSVILLTLVMPFDPDAPQNDQQGLAFYQLDEPISHEPTDVIPIQHGKYSNQLCLESKIGPHRFATVDAFSSSLTNASEILYNHFAPYTYVYLKPVPGFNNPDPNVPLPILSYWDNNLGPLADWKELQAVGANEEGILLDVTGFLPGDYKYFFRDDKLEKIAIFSISTHQNAQTFTSDPSDFISHVTYSTYHDRHYDVWDRIVKEISVSSYNEALPYRREIIHEYNDIDKETRISYPPVDVVDEHGVRHTNEITSKRMAFNVLGHPIGIVEEIWSGNPNGYAKAEVCDAAGQVVKTVLPDSTVSEQATFNCLGQKRFYINSKGAQTEIQYNRTNQVVNSISPLNHTRHYDYDECGQRTSDSIVGAQINRFGHDVRGNSNLHVQPMGQLTRTHFHRSNRVALRTHPSHYTIAYNRDYFGRVESEKLLNNIIIHYRYDGKDQILSKIQDPTTPSTHQRVTLEEQSILYRRYDFFKRQFVFFRKTIWLAVPSTAPNKHLKYTYERGLLTRVEDLAENSVSIYEYDGEKRCIKRQVNLNNSLIRVMVADFDAKGRQTKAYDTNAIIHTSYTAGDDRRSQYSVFEYNGQSIHNEYWYEYDRARRVLIDQGVLVDGQIKITDQQGLQMTYQENLRRSEQQGGIENQFEYTKELQLEKSTSISGTTEWIYAPTGYRSQQVERSNMTLTCDIVCDDNGREILSRQNKNDAVIQTITYPSQFTPDGNPITQRIEIQTGGDRSRIELTFHYQQLESEIVKTITGYSVNPQGGRQDLYPALQYLDSNGQVCAKVTDAQNRVGEKVDQQCVVFDLTHDGIVLRKRSVPAHENSRNPSFNYIEELVFSDPSNRVFATYLTRIEARDAVDSTNNPFLRLQTGMQPVITRNGGSAASVNALSQSGGYFNSRGWSMDQIERTEPFPGGKKNIFDFFYRLREPKISQATARYGYHFMIADPVQAMVEHPRPYTYADYLRWVGGDDPRKGFENYIPEPMSSYPPPLPMRYTVLSDNPDGMTFEQISLAVTGSKQFAAAIAQANGYPISRICPANESLIIPQLQVNTNSYLDNANYQKLMAAIMGGFGPHIKFAQHDDGGSCFKLILTIVITVVAIIVAPALAPAFLSSALGTTAAVGVTAALVDATLQGIAVGIGALDKFSLSQVISTGFAAGATSVLGAEGAAFDQFKLAVSAANINYSTVMSLMIDIATVQAAAALGAQMAQLAVGAISKLDLGAIVKQVAMSLVDLGIKAKAGLLTFDNNPKFLDAINESIVSISTRILGNAVMGLPVNLEDLLAQELGNVLGNAIGARIRGEIELHNKKSDTSYSRNEAKSRGAHDNQTYLPPQSQDHLYDSDNRYQESVKNTSNNPVNKEAPKYSPILPRAFGPEFDVKNLVEQSIWHETGLDDSAYQVYRRTPKVTTTPKVSPSRKNAPVSQQSSIKKNSSTGVDKRRVDSEQSSVEPTEHIGQLQSKTMTFNNKSTTLPFWENVRDTVIDRQIILVDHVRQNLEYSIDFIVDMDKKYQLGTRIEGLFKVVEGAGIVTLGTGIGFGSSYTGVGVLVGGAIVEGGADFMYTGFSQVLSGIPQQTLVGRDIDYIATKAGINLYTVHQFKDDLGLVMGVGSLATKGAESLLKYGGKFFDKSMSKVGPQILHHSEIKFAQSSVNDLDVIIESMKINGWKGPPIDVVKLSDGSLVSVDQTRLLGASITNTPVKANIYDYKKPLAPELAPRFTTKKSGVPNTWGEAVQYRINKQNTIYRQTYPNGSPYIGVNNDQFTRRK